MSDEGKITERHRRRRAVVYVRQSTPTQVERNHESRARQYALRERAIALGWSAGSVSVVDEDLGRSGASMDGRLGFKELVAEVGLGHVGLILALETSRLARCSADWHRLLDLCALTSTLIADADGIYSPAEFNDRLLLGLKGTMSEAEGHLIRARMQGGLRNKAAAASCRLTLPVGLDRDDDGRIALTADDQVRHAIGRVFELWRRCGSARQDGELVGEDQLLPRRRPGERRVRWARATYHSRYGLISTTVETSGADESLVTALQQLESDDPKLIQDLQSCVDPNDDVPNDPTPLYGCSVAQARRGGVGEGRGALIGLGLVAAALGRRASRGPRTERGSAGRERYAGPMPPSLVSFVSLGPGDPTLRTARAAQRIEEADVVIGDEEEAGAERLIALARGGKHVVRAIAGEAFESPEAVDVARAVAQAGVAIEVVPGVGARGAVAAFAGVLGRTVRVAAADVASAVAGEEKASPLTLVAAAGTPSQRVMVTTAGEAGEHARALGPGAILVAFGKPDEALRWFERRPLFGKRVLVTRAREQAGRHGGAPARVRRRAARRAHDRDSPAHRPAAAGSRASPSCGRGGTGGSPSPAPTGSSARGRRSRGRGRATHARSVATRLAAIGPATARALERHGLRDRRRRQGIPR